MRAYFIPIVFLAALAMFGCSDGGSDSPEPNAAHPRGWIATHDAEAKASPNYADCVSCHGTDLKGSGGVVSCYLCHTFNTAPPLTVHPLAWTDPYVDHRNYTLANGYTSCAIAACHGTGEIPQGGETAPSCATASYDGRGCHSGGPGGAPHVLTPSWLLPSGTVDTSHVLASIANSAPCIGCHTLTGGGIEPACSQCHTAHNPNYNAATCNSCHNAPPDSALDAGGNARPNREGAHLDHDRYTSLPEKGDCAVCHNGTGTNTTQHYDTNEPANVAFLSTYNAKTGVAAYDETGGTCSNVRCHGGQTSPAWLTGTLTVNTGCESCHVLGTVAQAPQYNSVYSGRHSTHVGTLGHVEGDAGYSAPSCVVCHDVDALESGHFIGLDSPNFDSNPALSIDSAIGYDATNSTCSVNLAGCHEGTWGWSGAPHSVEDAWLLPSGTVSTSHVQASIANSSSCIGCHTYAGGGIDPACDECHTAHNPNYIAATCDSCHNTPPDGALDAGGDIRPNREGAHLDHDSFSVSLQDCLVCHNGAGTNTLAHYDTASPADVEFFVDGVTNYNSSGATADYNETGGNCSNISCHGGQLTPNWMTETLDVNTQCAKCHEAAPAQYNSYINPHEDSHTYHIDMGWQCTVCHNTTTLDKNHFTTLDTQTMEGPASETIGGDTTAIPAGEYVPDPLAPGRGSCTPSCHEQENW